MKKRSTEDLIAEYASARLALEKSTSRLCRTDLRKHIKRLEIEISRRERGQKHGMV